MISLKVIPSAETFSQILGVGNVGVSLGGYHSTHYALSLYADD